MEKLDFLFIKTQSMISFLDMLYFARVFLLVIAIIICIKIWLNKNRNLKEYLFCLGILIFSHIITPQASKVLELDEWDKLNFVFILPPKSILTPNILFFFFISLVFWYYFRDNKFRR
ncbi:hypothetical protein ACPF04_01250 [Campylobacter sp. MOP51]|uniref:hypothetical protein n=1 Tax=Campylobacter canis TaxID=3378588 RepID=UPI003C310C5A